LNYRGFTYDEVLKYTQEIAARKQRAYNISDSIRALEIKIEGYKKSLDTSEAENILKDAKIAFEKERYDEAENFLFEANKNIETKKAELTVANVITRSGKNFIEKNWAWILAFTAVAVVSGFILWKKYKIKRIQNKLKKLKIEQESLKKLMKKNQIKRFKKGNISDSTYRIRMEKYNERMNTIKQNIPVFEAMLKNKKNLRM
jgi:hypothetical protein